MIATLDRAAALLRLGLDGEANLAIVELVDALSASLAGAREEDVRPLAAILARTLEAQERGDVLRVADLLEHVLRPLLEAR